jgi:hypothetical protein
MADDGKQISNPFSTGGGGANFELQVQASFVALMLAGGFTPCLPCRPIHKVKLQGRYAGYNTDDLVVFTANADGSQECKLLGQVKHSISITARDTVFGEVIQAAWKDFNNASLFARGKDAIALITGPLSATDIADVRAILEWARSSESAEEFLTKVETANFSSDSKRAKLKAFRDHLDAANGQAVSDADLVLFLQHFHLLGYDLDIRSGIMHAVVHSLLGQYSQVQAPSLWTQIVQEVMSANQNAGTITRTSLPEDLRTAFTRREVQTMPEDLSRTLAPREAHAWDSSEYAPALVIANLLGAWNEKSEADKAVIERLTRGQLDAWLPKIREVLQLANSPIGQQNGVWIVKNRGGLWSSLGSRVFDEHLDILKECAGTILKERDPQFDLEPDQRFAAAVYGKVLAHSSHLRKGLADTLALLGSCPEPLVNCSHGKPETTAVIAIREIFDGADWVHWGSVNDVLPLLAEAAPDEFLRAVERDLPATPCPFDNLFAQEGGGIGGRNYLTGLLWALETIAWDEQYLVRATLALGALAERDPGGQWANRPSHSLTTIFLPWLPQTTASIDKRKVAIQTLQRESPGSAWKLLLSLLPNQVSTSSSSHKPSWRRMLPDEWKDGVSQKDYWDQVSIYAEMAVEIAVSDASALKQLIKHLDHLPEPALQKILNHLMSDGITTMPEEERLELWTLLTELARKHRRFADAEWALRGDIVSHIELAAARISPKRPSNLYRNLFCGRDWDLYEENGDRQEQERKLDERRQQAIQEILGAGGIAAIIEFAESVESPRQVGFTLGLLGEHEVDDQVLPDMLSAEDDKHRQFADGFVYGNYRREQWAWVDSLNVTSWSKADIGKLLVCVPFSLETWDRVDSLLGESAAEYWKRADVNPYQAAGDVRIAIDSLIEHGRPRAAIDCLARIVHDKQPLDRDRAINALLLAVSSSEPRHSLNTYHLTSIIQALQDDPDTNQDELLKVEWAYLPLLNKYNRASPRLLESRLASDPVTFCELIRIVFRSDKEQTSDAEPSEEQQSLAENAYRLLREWRTPPGMIAGDGFSGDAFKRWIETVKKSSAGSGHLKVALHQAGGVLIHCPPDPDGLWMHRDVADVLNTQDMEELRRGYSIAIYNSRGAHCVDPAGKPEIELARKYRLEAEEIEDAGYPRIATMLRNVAAHYKDEAEQIIARHASIAEMGGGE